MKLGLFGGTFDPVHQGHLLLAEQCREQCQLDEVWFIPAGNPPHKLGAAITPGKRRLEMLEFAIAGHPAFRTESIELKRTGPSYTVETLTELRRTRPTDEFFLLIGADSLRDLPQWREPRRILELATVVAVNRGAGSAEIPAELEAAAGPGVRDRIQFVEMPGFDVSARDVRRRVSEGRSIRFMTPRPVEHYIAQHGLYRLS